jgi:hypothetical protein
MLDPGSYSSEIPPLGCRCGRGEHTARLELRFIGDSRVLDYVVWYASEMVGILTCLTIAIVVATSIMVWVVRRS